MDRSACQQPVVCPFLGAFNTPYCRVISRGRAQSVLI